MKRLLRHMKHSEVRASTESALTTSAAVPSSGFTFVDNSQGASAAVAELSKSLDTAFEQIELEGDLKEQLNLQLQRLDNEASKYSNSRLTEDHKHVEWNCSLEEAQLITIAWECAAGAYDPTSRITYDPFVFRQDQVITPSIGGSRKVATFTTVKEPELKRPKSPFLPLLVVAVRGSGSKMDHMVNANRRPKTASSFIDIQALDLEGSELEAHSGFLSSAEVLEPMISMYLGEGRWGSFKHVLFTGHSAGGAVASLLCLRYLSRRNKEYTSTRFSCITFGSPPVIRPPISAKPQLLYGVGLMLNIINEFDLVTRADSPYVLSLVNLYRSIYQLPPVEEATVLNEGGMQGAVSTEPQPTSETSERGIWILPSAVYGHVGARAVLQMRINEGDSSDENGENLADELVLKAFKVDAEAFGKLLFSRITVHSRHCYRERVRKIAEGQYNGINH